MSAADRSLLTVTAIGWAGARPCRCAAQAPESARTSRRAGALLLHVVVQLCGELGQHLGGITVAAIGETTQLIHVTPLARQLDKLIHCVCVPALSPPTEV